MIQRFDDYDSVQAFGERRFLPKGGYLLKIMGTEQKTSSNGNKYVRVSFDIADGEYQNYYLEDYRRQNANNKKWRGWFDVYIPTNDGSENDARTKKRFKTFITCLEHSNNGYSWDWEETKWKGLFIGGLFNQKEYEKKDGSVGKYTQFKYYCSTDRILEENYSLPDDDLLDRSDYTMPQGFESLADDNEDGLPF